MQDWHSSTQNLQSIGSERGLKLTLPQMMFEDLLKGFMEKKSDLK
jgi:hypothetical protein